MLDCVGKRLNIGDKVVCSDMRYADLLIGEITGFTPKKARVRYERSEYFNAYGQEGKHEQLKESYQIFKYEDKVHAHWKRTPTSNTLYCSACDKISESQIETKYCPDCGAIMDEEIK